MPAEMLLLLASPLAGALVLALMGHQRRAPEVNAAFSALTFMAAAALVARVVADVPSRPSNANSSSTR